MPEDVTRWLTEIRTLQQQLAAAREERDKADASAANWRQLYEAEASQRRQDVERLQVTIATLRTEVTALRGQANPVGEKPQAASTPTTQAAWASSDFADLKTVEGLRAQLLDVLRQCDQLQQQLEAERDRHAQTRQSLTTALGETIDALTDTGKLVHQPGASIEPQNSTHSGS